MRPLAGLERGFSLINLILQKEFIAIEITKGHTKMLYTIYITYF